jgi:hypothetical protein
MYLIQPASHISFNRITIYDLQSAILEIGIFDACGKQIYALPVSSRQTIDISACSKGVYLIVIRDKKNNLVRKKLVKM